MHLTGEMPSHTKPAALFERCFSQPLGGSLSWWSLTPHMTAEAPRCALGLPAGDGSFVVNFATEQRPLARGRAAYLTGRLAGRLSRGSGVFVRRFIARCVGYVVVVTRPLQGASPQHHTFDLRRKMYPKRQGNAPTDPTGPTGQGR